LIDWTRDLHSHLASCLSHCATKNEEERARALLDYLAAHESEMERIVSDFHDQIADLYKAMADRRPRPAPG